MSKPTREEHTMSLPKIVSLDAWQVARAQLLIKEKESMHARDALAAARRTLPMVEITKDYTFVGPDGRVGLVDLFNGRRQLIIYHFMFAGRRRGLRALLVRG
jgi:predicted dithiol-disulfide oxidoreductase (DUF899 family)